MRGAPQGHDAQEGRVFGTDFGGRAHDGASRPRGVGSVSRRPSRATFSP